jgi:pyrimidine deaminase RibD-like protein
VLLGPSQLKGTLGIYENPKSDNPERQFMIWAIELSPKCKDEPDRPAPKVGAVLVKQGKIIGEAYRGELRPGDHAEYTLLQKKLETEIVAGSTLYVTVEPCGECYRGGCRRSLGLGLGVGRIAGHLK